MLEAEVKLALADAGTLRARLAALGAEARGSHTQVDTYFAHPQRDFRTTDEALRLRSEDGVLRVTYKGPKLDPPRKTREEIEFALGTDHATASALLERLGFVPAAVVRKRRDELALPGAFVAVIALDDVEGLGTYCEIEVPADDVAQGRVRLHEVQARLGLEALPAIAESYLELLAARAR
jgi:adenylate cyclase class 2